MVLVYLVAISIAFSLITIVYISKKTASENQKWLLLSLVCIFSDYLILGNYTNGVYIIDLEKFEVQRVAIEGYF